MKRKFFFKNLILFLTPFLIPLLILGTFSIIITQSFIKDNAEKNNMNILLQSKENIEIILKEIDSLSITFRSDPIITKRLKEILSGQTYSVEAIQAIDYIKNYIDVPANSKLYIHSIYVYYYNEYGNFISSTDILANLDDFTDTYWYESYIGMGDKKELWSESRDIKLYEFDREATPVVTIYKKLYSSGAQKGTGVVVLNIFASYVENVLRQLATLDNQSIIVVNSSNDIIFQNYKYPYLDEVDLSELSERKEQFYTIMINNAPYTISTISSDRYGWRYISIVPQKALYKLPYLLSHLTFALLIVSIVLGAMLSYYITRKNYNQVLRIISILESAENETTLPEMPSRVKDEYGYIIQNILKTFIEQSYLKVQLSEKKYKMQALELMALQSQMNPHFLNNTLHTIYWEVFKLSGKPNLANQMISNLTDILEYSLSNPSEMVSIEEEVKNTRSYIEIQKIRYKDKFDFIWEYDDEVVKYKVIRLLLQPLIENSLYHGIKLKEDKGAIKVKMHYTKPYVKISVIDSGIGMDKRTLKEIQEKLKSEGEYSEHIGLFNTNKRLTLKYGEKYGIKVFSKYGLGTVIKIIVPVE